MGNEKRFQTFPLGIKKIKWWLIVWLILNLAQIFGDQPATAHSPADQHEEEGQSDGGHRLAPLHHPGLLPGLHVQVEQASSFNLPRQKSQMEIKILFLVGVLS